MCQAFGYHARTEFSHQLNRQGGEVKCVCVFTNYVQSVPEEVSYNFFTYSTDFWQILRQICMEDETHQAGIGMRFTSISQAKNDCSRAFARIQKLE